MVKIVPQVIVTVQIEVSVKSIVHVILMAANLDLEDVDVRAVTVGILIVIAFQQEENVI